MGIPREPWKLPGKLQCGLHFEEAGPDAVAFAQSQQRLARPEDFVLEASKFCNLDLLQMYGPTLPCKRCPVSQRSVDLQFLGGRCMLCYAPGLPHCRPGLVQQLAAALCNDCWPGMPHCSLMYC